MTPSLRRPPPAARTSCRASPRCWTSMQVSEIVEVISPDTFKRPIYAGNAIQTVQSTDAKKVITVRTASFQARARGWCGSGRDGCRRGQSGPVDLCREPAVGQRPSGADLGQDHHFRRPRARLVGKVPGGHPAGCRQARRGGRRFARGGRRRLCAERLAGRPDRQGGRARPLHRCRHLRRHPAPRRHEGLRKSSSPSTRTRRRRSSRSRITASSAICSSSCRSSKRRFDARSRLRNKLSGRGGRTPPRPFSVHCKKMGV